MLVNEFSRIMSCPIKISKNKNELDNGKRFKNFQNFLHYIPNRLIFNSPPPTEFITFKASDTNWSFEKCKAPNSPQGVKDSVQFYLEEKDLFSLTTLSIS